MDNKDTKSDYKKLLRGYPNILTVPEVAEILGCSTKTIYRQIKRWHQHRLGAHRRQHLRLPQHRPGTFLAGEHLPGQFLRGLGPALPAFPGPQLGPYRPLRFLQGVAQLPGWRHAQLAWRRSRCPAMPLRQNPITFQQLWKIKEL